mmetsp:Transcript_58721/g.117944  ORF Transcript_58721/g.117944 Transcript_58721/m.117944 type:complete len:205 (+) Transcript_58721:871-1485(+)
MIHVEHELFGDVVIVGAGGLAGFGAAAVAPLVVALVDPRRRTAATTTTNRGPNATLDVAATRSTASSPLLHSRQVQRPAAINPFPCPRLRWLVLVELPICLCLGEKFEVHRGVMRARIRTHAEHVIEQNVYGEKAGERRVEQPGDRPHFGVEWEQHCEKRVQLAAHNREDENDEAWTEEQHEPVDCIACDHLGQSKVFDIFVVV